MTTAEVAKKRVLRRLDSEGFIELADVPDAAVCAELYGDWASEIQLDLPLQWSRANEFFTDDPETFQAKRIINSSGRSRVTSSPTSVASWINPAAVELSEESFDGFFSPKHSFGSARFETMNYLSTWKDLAAGIHGERYDAPEAIKKVAASAIEMQLWQDQMGRNVFRQGMSQGGRHRLAAMLALRAPVIPVMLSS